MHNLPAVLALVQHDGSSVDKSGPIIEMKCCGLCNHLEVGRGPWFFAGS